MHPWRGRSRPAQASLPVDNPEAVIDERHPQMIACETFLGHPVKRFDGVKTEDGLAPRWPWSRAWLGQVEKHEALADSLEAGEGFLVDGLVWHLEVSRGVIDGIVLGDQLYAQHIRIAPLSREREAALIEICRDRVRDVKDMLSGRLPADVFDALSAEGEGLIPRPDEIQVRCSCPDGRNSGVCKHTAALLLGLAERLERRPRELFELRGTDPEVLKGLLPPTLSQPPPAAELLIPAEAIAQIFDLGLDAPPPETDASLPRPVNDPDPLDVFLNPDLSAPPPARERAEVRAVPEPLPAAPVVQAGPSGSWLDDEDDFDDDLDDDMGAEVFGGGGTPSPVSFAADADGEEVLEIGRADLLELGLPSHRVQRWLADGTLLKTDKRGRYQLTPEAWSAIEPLLDEG